MEKITLPQFPVYSPKDDHCFNFLITFPGKKERKNFLAPLGKRDDNYLLLLFTEIIAWKISILAHGYLPHFYGNAVFWIHYN